MAQTATSTTTVAIISPAPMRPSQAEGRKQAKDQTPNLKEQQQQHHNKQAQSQIQPHDARPILIRDFAYTRTSPRYHGEIPPPGSEPDPFADPLLRERALENAQRAYAAWLAGSAPSSSDARSRAAGSGTAKASKANPDAGTEARSCRGRRKSEADGSARKTRKASLARGVPGPTGFWGKVWSAKMGAAAATAAATERAA